MVVAAVALAVGQKTPDENWQTYAPDKKLFSMKIPGAPAPAQGGFFETDDEKIAHRFFSGGIKSRVFNFEIMKAKKRSFLVSILYIQTAKSTKIRPFSKREGDGIDQTIGDAVTRSKMDNRSTSDGEITQWTYQKDSELYKPGEDAGRVYVKRSKTATVIVIVDYDYAKSDDPDIGIMLNSLLLRKS